MAKGKELNNKLNLNRTKFGIQRGYRHSESFLCTEHNWMPVTKNKASLNFKEVKEAAAKAVLDVSNLIDAIVQKEVLKGYNDLADMNSSLVSWKNREG